MRKIGQQKHDAAIEAAVMAKRGRPEMPEWLRTAYETEETGEQVSLDKIAAEYWVTTADGLANEGLLAVVDEGMLTSISLVYASMVIAGRLALKTFPDLVQRYMQLADRMGLNESARAKHTKPKAAEGDPELDAMAAFLGTGDTDSAVC